MIDQMIETLVQYLPTLMSSCLAFLVASFVKRANASSLVLKTDKREILDNVKTLARQTEDAKNNVSAAYTAMATRASVLMSVFDETTELLRDCIAENHTLHEQLEQIKKELVELKATVRKKEE